MRRSSLMNNVKSLRDEQERVQKKTFTNWINTYLISCLPPCKITDLFTEIKDGIKLLLLLEVLSGGKLQKENRPNMQRVHCLSNVRTALSFLESKEIKLVNINPADIVDGKPTIVLGLMWTIILYFQIEEQEDMIRKSLEGTELAERGELFKGSAKKALLAWAQNNLGDKYEVDLKDFGSSWRDGAAFNAMVHNIDPSLVDMDSLRGRTNRENLEAAFQAAESGLNIPRLLDAEDVDVDKPDEKSIMTYIAQFLKAYPEGGKNRPKLQDQLDAARQASEKERLDLDSIASFCRKVESEALNGDYETLKALQAERDNLQPTVDDLAKRRQEGRLLSSAPGDADVALAAWRQADAQLRELRWRLDSQLPGDLGRIGQWLARAEACLNRDWPADDAPDFQAADDLSERLREHCDIFSVDPQSVRRDLQTARRQPPSGVNDAQINDMDNRLNRVITDEPDVRRKLEYLEPKRRLLANLVQCDRKLPLWTGKCGKQQEVEDLFSDYNAFVIDGKLVDSVEQALESLRQQAEPMRKRDPAGSREADRFLADTRKRWDRVKRDVQGAGGPLEKAISSWKNYSRLSVEFDDWLPGAEQALRSSPDERDRYFADMPKRESDMRELNDAASHLTACCVEPVAAEIRAQQQATSRRWKALFEDFKKTEKLDSLERNRRDYHDGTGRLTDWLERSEALAEAEVACNREKVKESLDQIQEVVDQQEAMEGEFKTLSKAAQDMARELPKSSLDEMLNSLKEARERLQKLRRSLPEKGRGLRGILPQIETMESGLDELAKWTELGESLMADLSGELDPISLPDKTDAYKNHFSQAPNYKTSLDNKTRALAKIKASRVKGLNVADVEQQLSDLNQRFKDLTGNTKAWDKKLEQWGKLWTVYGQNKEALRDWLEKAGQVMKNEDADPEELLAEHNQFFEPQGKPTTAGRQQQQHQVPLAAFSKSAKELAAAMENATTKENIETEAQALEADCSEILAEAPRRLLRLACRDLEDRLSRRLNEAGDTLQRHQERFDACEPLNDILKDHEDYFYDGDFKPFCSQAAKDLLANSEALSKMCPEEGSGPVDRAEDLSDRLQALLIMAEALQNKLKNLPEKWNNFGDKLRDINTFTKEARDLLEKLNSGEELSAAEYKTVLERLQHLAKEIKEQQSNAEDARALFDELAPNSDPNDVNESKRDMDEALDALAALVPDISDALQRAPVMARALEYRESIEAKQRLFDDADGQLANRPPLDDKETAQRQLSELRDLRARLLDAEKAAVSADLANGDKLSRERHCPAFVAEKRTDLEEKWRSANETADERLAKLEAALSNWASFMDCQEGVERLLDEADAIADGSASPPGGSDAIRSDIELKERLLRRLSAGETQLEDLRRLAELLKADASPERAAELDAMVQEAETRLSDASAKVFSQVGDLRDKDRQWRKLYDDLDEFEASMKDREALMDRAADRSLNPEERNALAQDLADSVRAAMDQLEKLEAGGCDLIDSAESNEETKRVKARIEKLRNRVDELQISSDERAKEAAHGLEEYEAMTLNADKLSGFLQTAEEYLASPVPKLASLEELETLCDEHSDFLSEKEKLVEAVHELDQLAQAFRDNPELRRRHKDLKDRWDSVGTDAEKRSAKLHALKDAWHEYEEEKQQFQEKLKEFEEMYDEDPERLKDKLDAVQALKLQLAEHEDKLDSLSSRLNGLRPDLTDAGAQELQDEQEALEKRVHQMADQLERRRHSLDELVAERAKTVADADGLRQWAERCLSRHERWAEVQASQVPEVLAHLRAIRSEVETKGPEVEQLGRLVAEYLEKSPTDADDLHSAFNEAEGRYSRLCELTKDRTRLCEDWLRLESLQADTTKEIKRIETQLGAFGVGEAEIEELQGQLETCKTAVTDFTAQSRELDELMERAEMRILQRSGDGSDELLNFAELLSKALQGVEQAEVALQEKRQLAREAAQAMDDMREVEGSLLDYLKDFCAQLNDLEFDPPSRAGVNKIMLKLDLMEEELKTHQDDLNELKAIAKELAAKDASKSASAQEILSRTQDAWRESEDLLAEKYRLAKALLDSTQAYEEKRKTVQDLLEKLDELRNRDMASASPEEVRKWLDEIRQAEQELAAAQKDLDAMQQRAGQICRDAKDFAGFDQQRLLAEADGLADESRQMADELREKRKQLEQQAALWDAVADQEEDLNAWLEASQRRLDEAAEGLADTDAAKDRLARYRDEKADFQAKRDALADLIDRLEALNGGQPIESLRELLARMDARLAEMDASAEELAGRVEEFEASRDGLDDELREAEDRARRLKDALRGCDNQAGPEEELAERLKRLRQQVRPDLDEATTTADSLLSRAEELGGKFATPASKRLLRDAQTVAKRNSSLGDLANAAEERLRRGLEGRCHDRQRDLDAWLAAAGEATEWTPAADEASVEAQLAVVEEALSSLGDGETKLNGLRASTDLLLDLCPPDSEAAAENVTRLRDESETKFQALADSLAREKDRLLQLKDQLEELAAEESGLRSWLLDAEDELKSAQALAATPEDKERQAERLRALQAEAADRQADFEALMDKARSVSDATGDARPLNTVTEFQDRFKRLSQSVSESMEEAEARAEEHRVFLERLAAANDWLAAAVESLEEVAAMPDGDRDGLQMKLGQLKAALDGKDEGSSLMMQAQQEAEKVLPKSDAAGRETVRRDTADLRQRFDEWSERGAELERRLEAALMQWSDYDDNYQQLVRWLKDVEYTVTSDLQLKANLPDKRSQLQFYRSRLHDISSHEPILGVVTERGQQLSAPSVLAKLNQLRNRFNDSQGAAKKNVKLCEDMVEQHQAYQDAFQMASDWLHAANEKVAHCDDGQNERAALEAKIDRISTLASGLQDGEAKVTQALKEGEKTLQQTAESGQEIIKKEMDWLDRGLEEAKTKCEDMRRDFEQQVANLDAFEAHYDELFALVKEREADLKEASGQQANARDKRDQLNGLEQLASELTDRTPDFEALLAESHRLQDARLSQQGSQLSSRFNGLRAAVEDAVAAAKRQAAEHEAFDSAVEQLVSTLDSLAVRCDEAYREDEVTPDTLPAAQTALAGLQEELQDVQPELARVMEQAERLFAGTTPEGREAIQEDTGHLRKLSDQVSEQLADSQAKVENQLQENAMFKSTLGQLRQWLSGLQDRLEGPLSTERQTLPDRRTQLQSHRAFQQELASGDHRLEQLRSRLPRRCSDQEQADTDQAADDFAELQERSRELLQKREATLRALLQFEESREVAATQLAGAKEKLAAAADGGSDRAASQLRVEKLREVLESLPDVEEAAADFAKATDEAAGLVGEDQAAQLRAEATALEEELATVASEAEKRLRDAQEAADQLADLERAVDELTRLLRTADGQSREREQQPSAQDKRRLADRMSELLAGLEELEALSDRLNDIATPVQGRDPRLDQAVAQANSRLPALRVHLTESAGRWNRLADEHEALDQSLEEFTDFLANAESDASSIGRRPAGTREEVEAKLRDIAELRSRLLSRGDDLRSLCEAAETVISGTAPAGREQIKGQVKGFKEDSDALDASLEDEEQRLQAYLGQLVSFTDAKETLLEWLDAAEARLADADAEAEVADTLEAKKRRATELRALLQEIQSQHRPLELALDKAQCLQAAASATVSSVGESAVGAGELSGFIQEASRRYDALKSQAKEMLTRAEEEAADLQQAETGLQSATDWVASMRDRLTPALATPPGERPRLASRLERLQELESQRDDGERRLQACAEAVRKATTTGAPETLRQRLHSELETVEADFRDFCRECETARADVEERLERLHQAEALESQLEGWLVEQERAVREAATPRASLEEKSAQLTSLQSVCESATDREAEFTQLEAALEDLEASGSQSAINLLAKYQALKANSQQAAERCQAAIEEHRRLQDRLSAAEGEVAELEAEASGLETTCSVDEIPERRRRVEALLAERKPALQTSLQELGSASAAAAASAGVGAVGHDQLRRETRRVKSSFDAVCERLVTLRRALEQRAAQVDDLNAQLNRLAVWIAEARNRLEESTKPQDSLDARKQQLQACRALSSELNSVAKQPPALEEQLTSLAKAGHIDASQMTERLDELAVQLDGISAELKTRLADCEEAVREQAAYREARDEADDWVTSLAERVEFCDDLSGDRHALEGRLERLKELAGGHAEADNRLSQLEQLAGAARRRATPDGAAAIDAEVADLRRRWSELATRADSLQSELRNRAAAWVEYEDVLQRCAGHTKAAEAELKEAQEPRATLEEKLALTERLDGAVRALESADPVEADFADLAHRAGALAAASRGESHVTGQAGQLANRRAGLLEQLREATSRSKTQAGQHRAFDAEVSSFADWLDAYESRLDECQKANERAAAQNALRTAGQLLAEREDGFRRAQAVQDRLQPALATTAAPGREKLRSAAHSVQARWDACAAALGSARHRLEAALAQWTLYEEGAGQVERWSRELQEQLERDDQEAEAAVAAPLADQWARLERLRGHQMAARSRQPAARSFADKALALAPGAVSLTLENGELADAAPAGGAARRLSELADGYDQLAAVLDERLRDVERQLREARAFREALSEAQDWLTLAAERLGPTETAATAPSTSPSSESAPATDRSSLESGLTAVRALLDQAPVGEQRLARAEERAEMSPAPAAARQETARLRAAFDDLLIRCRTEATRLQTAVDGWSAYDATYAGLKDWLASTEKRLQPEQLGSSLDEKQKLAEEQDQLSEEVAAKLNDFRGLAQQSTRLLGDGGADLKVSTQLAKLLARYHGLAALARDHAQKLRCHADDHAEFDRNAAEAERWIAEARERLALARREPDDRYGLQRQRERLAELAMKREEGQVLAEAAAHWADKAERNTAPAGRDALRAQAQRVQTAWDCLVRELLETRATSEQRLQKWTELDDSVEKVARWIKEREERLLTLNEAKQQQQQDSAIAVLQRLRELQQEVAAYEPVALAASERCRAMGRQEAAEQLPASHAQLRRDVETRLADAEATAERRREFQQALQEQRAWLQRSRTTLGALQQEAKAAGDLVAVRRNLAQASTLLADVQGEAAEARMTRLHQLAAAADAMPEALECQEKAAGLRAQVAEICGSLERLTELWEAFQSAQDTLEASLKDQLLPTSASQQQSQALGDSAEEKRRLADQMQQREQMLRERQSEAEALAEQARALVELGADQRATTGAASQLAGRVRATLDKSAEQGRAALVAAKQHGELDLALGELDQWLSGCRERLASVTASESPEQTERQLAELQTELESGRSRLRAASELADRVLPATGAQGVERLRAALQKARREHESAQMAVGEARTNADMLLSARRDFQRQADQLAGWLSDAEAKLSTSTESAASGPAQQGLTERRAALERARVLQREAASQEAALRRIQERAGAAGGDSRERANGIARRHEELTAGLAQLVERLASSVTGQQEFQESAERAAAWLTQARARLTQAAGGSPDQLPTPSGTSATASSRGDLDARAEQLANLRSDAGRTGQPLMDRLAATAAALSKARAPNAAEAANEADRLTDDFRSLLSEAEAAEARLMEASRLWRGFQDCWQRLADWVKDAEQRLRRGNEPAANLDAKRRQAREFQVMSDEIHAKRPELDKLQSLGDSLEQLTGHAQAAARVAQLALKYQSLMTQCSEALVEANQRLHQISSDIKAYEEAHDSAKQWIDQATQRLLNSSGCHGDAGKLAEKRRAVREISDGMYEGESRLSNVMEAGDRVLRTCDNPDAVRRQMDEMRADWSQLSKQVQQVLTGLDKAAAKLGEFGDLVGRLSGWLGDSERTLAQLTGGAGQRFGETPEKKEQYDRFKSLKSEVDRTEGDFDELQQLCDELQAIGKQPDLDRQCKDLRYRYNQLKRAVGLKVDELARSQQEQQAYQDGLQECEKWILQASFRLMEQSTGQAPSLDDAQRAADAHAIVCKEIEEQRKALDSVVRIGRKLAEDNSGNADLRQEIDGQLKTLEDNYTNLKETAENAKSNLKENLQKWKTYRDLLQATDRWLHSDLAAWWAGRDPAVTKSAEDAERQTQETRGMQSRLSQARAEVTAAGFKCEPRGCVGVSAGLGIADSNGDAPFAAIRGPTISSPGVPSAAATAAALSLARLAEKVSRDLDANLDRVERRLSQLETQRDAWERVSAEADDLSDWLRDREAEAGALVDVFAIERLRDEVAAKSISHELAEAKPQLKAARDSLLRRLDGMAAQKRQAEALEEERKQRQMAKELEMEELRLRVSRARLAAAAPSGDGADVGSPHWDRQTQTPCHTATQTNKKQQAASAMDLTDSSLFDRPVRDIQLRNSGGGSGISRRLWPYHSTWDTSYKEDPIESLRRTLADMEAHGISSAQQVRQQPVRPMSAASPHPPTSSQSLQHPVSARASTPVVGLTRTDAFNDVLASARGESVRRSAPSTASLSASATGKRAASAPRRNYGSGSSRRDRSVSPAVGVATGGGSGYIINGDNDYDETGASDANRRLPQPSTKQLTKQFVRDYEQLLVEPGNHKQPSPRSSLDRAERASHSMRDVATKLRKS